MLEYKVDYEAAYKELVELLHDGINKELNKPELFNLGYSEAMHSAWLESIDIIHKHITQVYGPTKCSFGEFFVDKLKGV